MSWGTQAPEQKAKPKTVEPVTRFDEEYYTNLFENNRTNSITHRCALVGHENTLKTGLALSFLAPEIAAGKMVYVFDIDNSAKPTIDHVYPDAENVIVLPLHDETDDSIFDEDNNVDYKALLDKTAYYVNILAKKVNDDPESIGGIIFDGGSTFLKWCEHAMRASLLARGVIEEESDTFNQKEWRERNRLYRNILTRLHSLNVAKVYFVFHLKPVSQYMDDGTGKKVLMTVGHRPEWDKGTMRKFSQQIFLSRHMKKADMAAGIEGDRNLNEKEWVVRGKIEEMKGEHIEKVGSVFDIARISNGKFEFVGLEWMVEDNISKPEKKPKPEKKTMKARGVLD